MPVFICLFEIVVTFFLTIITYYQWCFQYWKKKGIPYINPKIPFGICSAPFLGQENWAFAIRRYYQEMKTRGWKHGGFYFFASPMYLLVDLSYVKNIFTADFQYFTDRVLYYHETKDFLNAHLLGLPGPKWKVLRTKMNPSFSSSKTRLIFQTLADCRGNLLTKMNELCGKPVDIKEISACFTTDVIGSCFFGLDFQSFESEDSPFRVYGKKLFCPSRVSHFKRSFGINFPKLATFLNFCVTPEEINEFFLKIVQDTVNYRERNAVTRNDFLQLLIEMQNSDDGDGTLTMKELAAQCFGMLNAGFETSSSLMSFALYELARNPRIQQRVREEISGVLEKHNEISYDSIKDMKFLDQVVDETLRMYPPAPLLNRRCVKDYKIRDEDVIIEKGTLVLIPVLGLHYDEEFFPEPEKFDPERFSAENKSSIPRYAYLPFGEGPRICIGKWFGLVQAKVGLSCLLKNFKFTVNPKTEEPLRMPVTGYNLCADNIWLDAVKI